MPRGPHPDVHSSRQLFTPCGSRPCHRHTGRCCCPKPVYWRVGKMLTAGAGVECWHVWALSVWWWLVYPVGLGLGLGRDWRPGWRQGAGPHRDLLGSKGLEGHPGVLLGEPTESWALEKHLLSLEDLHWTNGKDHPTHDNIQLDPLTGLLPLCFMNKYNTTVVPYMYTINTRTKIIEVADVTNPQQVCTYL